MFYKLHHYRSKGTCIALGFITYNLPYACPPTVT
jgi:hypothetical protein